MATDLAGCHRAELHRSMRDSRGAYHGAFATVFGCWTRALGGCSLEVVQRAGECSGDIGRQIAQI